MLFLDRPVDLTRPIGVTGNKPILSSVAWSNKSGLSRLSPQKDKEQNIHCVFFCFNPASCSVLPASPFQPANAEADQNTENRVTSWPQAQTAETAASIKTEVLSHSIETPYELVMVQIILFAPDTDNPFWRLKSLHMLNKTNCSIFLR